MIAGAILTLGLGTFSDVNHLVTLGYGTSAATTRRPRGENIRSRLLADDEEVRRITAMLIQAIES
jgi:hypothetical protein